MLRFSIAGWICATGVAAHSQDYGFDFVAVGDAGNSAYQTASPFFTRADGRGAVDYEFRITRTEVQYDAFVEYLFARAPFSGDPTSPGFTGNGIFGFFLGGEYTVEYRQFYRPGMPASIPFAEALRMANWYHNDKAMTAEAFDRGAYDFSTFQFLPDGRFFIERSPDARFWVPNIDELLKASFYDPDKNGEGPGWWMYPNSSDEAPMLGRPEDGGETNINFLNIGDIDLFASGTYEDAQSPWGLLDVSGGVSEWMDEGLSRGTPGIARDTLGDDIDSVSRGNAPFMVNHGFRLATTVPAPGVSAMVMVGVLTFGGRRRGRDL